MNRRSFTKLAIASMGITALASAVKAQSLTGEGTPQPTPERQITSEISNNHGHVLILTIEDLVLRPNETFNIQGSSRHGHDLNLTQENIIELIKRGSVEVQSSNVGHSHTVLIQLQGLI